jgi:formate dehydrogenase iron-sulfur subunit
MGAGEVADAVAARLPAGTSLVRNGSRGLYWLEPLVEVETPQGRIAYGPVTPDDVESLFAADFLAGGEHPLRLGFTDQIPYLAKQERLTCARVGVIDPVSLDDYRAHRGFAGLERALAMAPADIVKEVTDSGLRGRGGAAFPTGIKWKTVLDQKVEQKYITCNADEGDSGTFSDRMIMEGDPFVLIEGMIIAGLAVGASQGFIYLRVRVSAREAGARGSHRRGVWCWLPRRQRAGQRHALRPRVTHRRRCLHLRRRDIHARESRRQARRSARAAAATSHRRAFWQADGRQQRDFTRERADHPGERRRVLPRLRHGPIARHIADPAGGQYQTRRSRREGVRYHAARTVVRIRRRLGVGPPDSRCAGRGPLGAYMPESQFDTPIDYESFDGIGALLGHGGIVAFDDTVDMAAMAQYAMEFCAHESCGKCTPCRIGSTRGAEIFERIRQGRDSEAGLALIGELCETMLHGSLCGLGGLTPYQCGARSSISAKTSNRLRCLQRAITTSGRQRQR